MNETVGSTLAELIKNPLIVSLISATVAVLLTVLVSKVTHKTAVLRYSVRVDRVGMAADDAIFGSIRITWKEKDVRNLYTATLEVENATTRDYENLELLVYSERETILLNERTRVADSPYAIGWSDKFINAMKAPEGAKPTQAQLNRYNHEREYVVPAFNRGQKVFFTYLCTRPFDDRVPLVWVSTLTPGVKLKYNAHSNVVLGVPVTITLWRGLIVSVLAVTGCGLFLSNIWIAAIIAMIVGLTVHFIGALEYKVERYLWSVVSE